MAFEAVLLVGHGGVPKDAPRGLVAELKRLEGERRARGLVAMEAREIELDRTIRAWPRTPLTDPYQAGLEAVAARLAPRVHPRRLAIAYNEFCAPSVEDAIATLTAAGAARLVLVTTMFTPGGSHAELEIPEIVALARARHPDVAIEYAWPYDLDHAAEFLARHLEPTARQP